MAQPHLSIRRTALQGIRVKTLTPLLALYILAADLILRIVLAIGNQGQLKAFLGVSSRGLTRMLKICWGLKFSLTSEITRMVRSPGHTLVIANHHSPLDIAVLMHLLGVRPVHFVCRAGLEKGIPFVSLLVRRTCTILKADPTENEVLLRQLGERIAASDGVAVIFPEGIKTVKTYPHLLPFMPSGIEKLLEGAPSARIVAVAIRGTHAGWPGPWGQACPGSEVEVSVADVFTLRDVMPGDVARRCEKSIRQVLNHPMKLRPQQTATWTSSPTP